MPTCLEGRAPERETQSSHSKFREKGWEPARYVSPHFKVLLLMRHPIEQFFSGATFFFSKHFRPKKGSPQSEQEQREQHATKTAVLEKVSKKETASITLEDVKMLRPPKDHQIPHQALRVLGYFTGETAPLVLPSRPKQSTMALLEKAKEVLNERVVVGVTEEVESFLTLAAYELGWDLERMCLHASFKVQEKSLGGLRKNYRGALTTEARDYLESSFELDLLLYDYARELHETLKKKHKENGIDLALERMSTDEFRGRCEAIANATLLFSPGSGFNFQKPYCRPPKGGAVW